MEVSPNTLRKETVGVLQEINLALGHGTAADAGPERATLLLGKATCLHTLTLLRDQGTRR